MESPTLGARTLRWPTESALARCAGQIAAACAAWAEAWTGQALQATVQPAAAPGWPQRSLALATGERVALAGADLAALFAVGEAPVPDRPDAQQGLPYAGAASFEAWLAGRAGLHMQVRGGLRLADLHLPLGALMQAEAGDVIVLDRKLDALFEWEAAAIGLRLPAQLVRTGDHLAVELL